MKKILLGLILSLFLITPAFAVDNWTPLSPLGSNNAADIDTLVQTNNNAIDRLLAYGRWGAKLTYASTSTLTVGIGSVVCSNTAGTTRKLRANSTATTVSWANIDTGTEAGSTTYYVYAIGDADTATFTCVISTNSVTPQGASHDYYKRLGSFYNDASSNITNVYDDDFTITQTQLKTTYGEVSAGAYGSYTLPGGEYGFYPQLKNSAGAYSLVAFAWNTGVLATSYSTRIYLAPEGGGTVYAQQRYVTASGEDMWVFLLIDKETDNIVGSYSAPDHPAFGNGGDFAKVPHPFGDIDLAKYDVILVEKDTVEMLQDESQKAGKSLLEYINENYKPRMSKKEVYIPLHSGKFIDSNGKQVKEMVSALPEYISVRKMTKLTKEELDNKKIVEEAELIANKTKLAEDKLINEKMKQMAIDELKKEGKI